MHARKSDNGIIGEYLAIYIRVMIQYITAYFAASLVIELWIPSLRPVLASCFHTPQQKTSPNSKKVIENDNIFFASASFHVKSSVCRLNVTLRLQAAIGVYCVVLTVDGGNFIMY